MRKYIFLTLLLTSKLILSQSTNTNQSEQTKKCFPIPQVTEIYKGLKQRDQLEKLYYSAQETIDNSNTLIASQKKLNDKLTEESSAKSELIQNQKDIIAQDRKICEIQKESLQKEIKYLEQEKKKDSRKAFWNGVKIGGFSVVTLGAAALIFLNN